MEVIKPPVFLNALSGEIRVPPSKSLTNRMLPFGALSTGDICLRNVLRSEDTDLMAEALRSFGVCIGFDGNDPNTAHIRGCSGKFPGEGDLTVFCGNSGTTIRFLSALSVLRNGKTILTGGARMKERPIGDLVECLRRTGIGIDFLEKEGFPPIEISGTGSFRGGEIEISGGISSQFLSALLLLSPFAEKETIIRIRDVLVSRPYAEMTLQMLKNAGVEWRMDEDVSEIRIFPKIPLSPDSYDIEPDATAATYPLAIAALTGGDVAIPGISRKSLQGDARFSEEVLMKMGCSVSVAQDSLHLRSNGDLSGLGDIDLGSMPDAAMTAVVLGALARGKSRISGLSTLRSKECDRINALGENLRKMGAEVRWGDAYIEVMGDPLRLHGAEIETYDDHRIAMCFAVLAAKIPEVSILNPECVQKTYPDFWDDYLSWGKSYGNSDK